MKKVIKIITFYLLVMLIFSLINNNIWRAVRPEGFMDAFWDKDWYILMSLSVKLGLFFLFSGLITLSYLAKNAWVRNGMFFLTFAMFSIALGYQNINGAGFSTNEANVLVNEIGFGFLQVFKSFWKEIVLGCLSAGVITGGIFYLAMRLPQIYRFSLHISVAPLLTLCILYGVVAKGGDIVHSFPVVIQLPLQVFFAYKKPFYQGPRDDVVLTVGDSKFKKIILIVDESIRGDMLTPLITPYLHSIKSKIFDYGIASSLGNCSASSNIYLQSSIMMKDFPDKDQRILKNPSLFQYARKAGFHTAYMNGQGGTKRVMNFMRKPDFDHIDENVDVGESERRYMDQHLADLLTKKIKKQDKVFIYVNKVGAHFHYSDTYPENQEIFKGEGEKEERIAQYKNAVRWTVDAFFNKFLNNIKDEDVLIFYLSDHGQSLMENGEKETHCKGGKVVPSVQAKVPLMIFATGKSFDKLKPDAARYLRGNKNKLSHINVMPTILYLMGYDRKEISNNFEPTMFDNISGERYFISGDIFGMSYMDQHLFKIE